MSGAAGAPAGARADSRIDMGDPSAGPSQQEVINAFAAKNTQTDRRNNFRVKEFSLHFLHPAHAKTGVSEKCTERALFF